MDENIIPAPRRKGQERRKNMTLSPQVSSNHRPGKKLITRGLMWLTVSVSVDEEPITRG
ncbi:MAG: hypothetical protein ABIN54_07340 [candidate division WOR-3 bacterium]